VGKDCEIRAKNFAEMAIYTIFHFPDFREIITLEIEVLGHSKHIAGAILNTKLTALAPFFDHGYLSLDNLNGLQIKGNAPIFHMEVPFLCRLVVQ
jgi:hypothetical protein